VSYCTQFRFQIENFLSTSLITMQNLVARSVSHPVDICRGSLKYGGDGAPPLAAKASTIKPGLLSRCVTMPNLVVLGLKVLKFGSAGVKLGVGRPPMNIPIHGMGMMGYHVECDHCLLNGMSVRTAIGPSSPAFQGHRNLTDTNRLSVYDFTSY